MTHAKRMSETNPSQVPVDADPLVVGIEACFDCADACLNEEDVQMLARCIRLDLDCADQCDATGKILSRQTSFDVEMAAAALRACAEACRLCGKECEWHAGYHEHCRVCAQACRRCESACNNLLSSISA